MAMTPAIRAAEAANVSFRVLEYVHDPAAASYGLEAAEALNVEPREVFKTLVVQSEAGKLAVGVVPVVAQLDLKAMAAALGVKRVALADPSLAERTTGYVVGGISPLGQRKPLPTVVDESVIGLDTVYVSAGRRGLEIALLPSDLVRLCRAAVATIAR